MTCDDEPAGVGRYRALLGIQGPARRKQMFTICIIALVWPAPMNAGLSEFNLPDWSWRCNQNQGVVGKNFMKTTNTNEPTDAKLSKLREREFALKQQAQQLQARAEHLSRVGRGHLERLARRVDAHEKIVLGALVKKAGLDVRRIDDFAASKRQENISKSLSMASNADEKDDVPGATSSNQHLNAVLTSIFHGRIHDDSANYDRELVLGGLLWLVNVLTMQPGDGVVVPAHSVLRDAGRLAGANAMDKKSGRTEH